MKMVMVIYNEAIDLEASELLKQCGLSNYTKITGVFGKGATSGTHLGNDIWPGRNNILYVVAAEEEAGRVLSAVRDMRKKLGHEGIKAFVLPIEDLT